MIRKATQSDIDQIVEIYNEIFTEDEKGAPQVGWKRGIYPTRETAEKSLAIGELFVEEDNGKVVSAGRINQDQAIEYKDANWEFDALDSDVMVLHTLVVSPSAPKKGYGSNFVHFYEDFARKNNCKFLRLDTMVTNKNARAFYKKLGYNEVGFVDSDFNGIGIVKLVCLEKKL
ncbi:GNAT family N-acetyltransferase [Intestinibacter sp.]|uniref:GNAT family N-acetyltransferase n=1 Tax=Intestinibacter sp. TaxID=1965304 RepID=UPI003F192757